MEQDWYRSDRRGSQPLAKDTSVANRIRFGGVQTAKRTQFGNPLAMTSYRQIEANRRNALKSTGPKTGAGKRVSRCNAARHGLTAETVIGALEDAEDYKAFEAAITADYDAQSAVERELVLRLASILWRLRRSTTMETGLFEIQADHMQSYRKSRELLSDSRDVIHTLFRRVHSDHKVKNTVECAGCFLRLANLPNFALDRPQPLRSNAVTSGRPGLIALDALDRRKPQERRRNCYVRSPQSLL